MKCNLLYPIFASLAFVSCTPKVLTSKTNIEFDLQGHRGSRGLMPENTIAAMLKAAELGVTTLEMDVVITADKKVILSHEPWMNEEITTRPDGNFIADKNEARTHNIYKLNYEEVKKYDVGKKPHPRFPQQQKIAATKPQLQNVIAAAEAYTKEYNRLPVQYNIETKSSPETDGIYHPPPSVFIDLLLPVLKAYNVQERTIIQSFDIRTLQYLHKTAPHIKTAVLIDEGDTTSLNITLTKLGFTPTVYSPYYGLVTTALVQACHVRGIRIIPWTVNDIQTMKHLKKMGVDGLISDYPNLYKKL